MNNLPEVQRARMEDPQVQEAIKKGFVNERDLQIEEAINNRLDKVIGTGGDVAVQDAAFEKVIGGVLAEIASEYEIELSETSDAWQRACDARAKVQQIEGVK